MAARSFTNRLDMLKLVYVGIWFDIFIIDDRESRFNVAAVVEPERTRPTKEFY